MVLVIRHPGLSTTLQDLGRPGHRRLGVPLGGAADRRSLVLANALVGNPPSAAALEFTATGGTFLAWSPLLLAIAGAPLACRHLGAAGAVSWFADSRSFSLRMGDELKIDGSPVGLRAYLAVRGGWLADEVLGSRSSEGRAKRGDFFQADPAPPPCLHRSLRPIDIGFPTGPVRVLAGPDAAAHPDALEHLLGTEFRLTPQSDRIGLRLKGTDWTKGLPPDRPSSPLSPGAVQFTGAEWLILGVAGGTMGGYPHIAQVISADLDRLGQVRPADRLRFEVVTLEAARRIDRESRRAFDAYARIVRAGFDPG